MKNKQGKQSIKQDSTNFIKNYYLLMMMMMMMTMMMVMKVVVMTVMLRITSQNFCSLLCFELNPSNWLFNFAFNC